MKSQALKIVVAAAAFAAAGAMAQGYGPGSGPGMGGGFGPCGGAGPGIGYGPGMGYGPGRGYGRGMGSAPLSGNLTDDQRAKIAALQDEHRAKNWKAMDALRSEQFKLRDLYASGNADSAAIEAQQKKVAALREQMFQQHQAMRGEIDAVLTPEQRKERLQRGPWWARERSS